MNLGLVKPRGFEVKEGGYNLRVIDSNLGGTNLKKRMLVSLMIVSLLVFFPQIIKAVENTVEKVSGTPAGHGSMEVKAASPPAAKHDVQEELGKLLPYWTVAPFIFILLAIALLPLFSGHWWESNLNKGVISTFCSLPVIAYLGTLGPLGIEVLAEVLKDYYAFIILLVALFTISGGIHLEGNLKATPLVNTTFLGLGALLASFIGTTGAAMLLIRPLLNTNRERKFKKHIFIFFIFLVANIGGSLLPVGDPPLFLGYLFGVPFFWTLRLWPIWLTEVTLLLFIFYFWDTRAYSKESQADLRRDLKGEKKLKVHGLSNIVLILGVLCSVIFLKRYYFGAYTIDLAWMQQPVMILLALISFVLDHKKKEMAHKHGHLQFKSPREHNAFTFYAMIEVAVLFIGIFITMTPAICLLKAYGAETGVKHAWQFFWMSGGLSSFLDNAPTYATYFALGQGVTKGLLASGVSLSVIEANTGPIAESILMAISAGAVFMGANTYIGNAPNFMVKSICEEAKVKMPSFFGYMLYSGFILIPSFLLIMFIYLW
jgi:Na+/H+ antiporter NhaD/arsenite permease-like protein